MSEPMQNKHDDSEDERKTQKRKGVFKKGIHRMKSDFQHGSRVEEGSLVDGARKTFRALFPKK